MNLLQRFGYYLVGLSIGLVIVFFFFKEKGTTFDYGFDARVLKSIRIKKIIYAEMVVSELTKNNLDSTAINHILKKGDVNFSESLPRQKPCAIYNIEGDFNNKDMVLTVENCDSIATITNLRILR